MTWFVKMLNHAILAVSILFVSLSLLCGWRSKHYSVHFANHSSLKFSPDFFLNACFPNFECLNSIHYLINHYIFEFNMVYPLKDISCIKRSKHEMCRVCRYDFPRCICSQTRFDVSLKHNFHFHLFPHAMAVEMQSRGNGDVSIHNHSENIPHVNSCHIAAALQWLITNNFYYQMRQ